MDTLVKLALVGTAKARTAELAEPSPLTAPIVDQLKIDDPSHRLLIAAGAELVCQRCGFLPLVGIQRPAPAETDTGTPCSPQLTSLLHQAMTAKQPRLLDEFLQAFAEFGVLAPPQWLPELLSLTDPALRRRLLPVLGDRGRWLSSFREDWNWVSDAITAAAQVDLPALKQVWEEGTSSDRQGALRRLRAAEPTLARQSLADGIDGEKADTRVALLETMAVGLSTDDEPFLESRLDDRSENVRRAAARLLAHLPGSQLAGRMRQRALAMLSLKTSGMFHKTHTLTCEPPEDIDKSWERDGISRKPPQSTGKRAHWAQSLVALVPPSDLSAEFQLEPAALISAAGDDPYGDAMLAGWKESALEFAAPDRVSIAWRRALAEHFLRAATGKPPGPGSRAGGPLRELIGSLPLAEVEDLAIEALHKLDDLERIALCDALPQPWTPGLTRALLREACRAMDTENHSESGTWASILLTAAMALPRELLGEAIAAQEKILTTRSAEAMENRISSFAETIRLRQTFYAALAALRPAQRDST